MQQNRFSVLTGHLADYPLADLVGILRHQQKTGRLMIEYAKGPAMLFFKDGEMIDAQFEQLSGLQAICVAFAQPPASFNFNPLIKPYRRSIESSLQKAVSELLGCWDENAVVIESSVSDSQRLRSGIPPVQPTLMAGQSLVADKSVSYLPEARTPLALPPGPVRNGYSPPVVAMAAAGILMIGISAFIGVSRGIVTPSSAAAPTPLMTAATEIAVLPTETEALKKASNEPRSQREPSVKPVDRRQIVGSPPVARRASNETGKAADKPQESDTQSTAPETRRTDIASASVRVVLQIENGRVTQASIGNRKAGMEAYEALALRIARQRRFPTTASGQQTVMVKID